MFRKRLREEFGYSLIEVMVSIILLAIAIIPMVGMFDMGLKSATSSGNYDAARALANANLDKVRALPWSSVQGATATYEPTNAPTNPASNPAAGQPVSCNQGVFTCSVTTTYRNDDFSPPTTPTATTLVQIDVLVSWQGKNYTITGLKTR